MQNPSVTEQANVSVGHKSNKAFMILSALGIIFVVDVHLNSPLSIMTSIFPCDSFIMPLFTFISGYFFKDRNCRDWKSVFSFSIHKFKKLMFPYLGWILFYNCLNSLLCNLGIWNIGSMSLREIIYGVVTTGVLFAFNSASWFVPLLFCMSVLYCMIRRIFRRFWNDTVAMLLFLGIGTAAVYAAGTAFNVPLHYLILKTAFFLQFYHMGVFFRNHVESRFTRLSTAAVCLTAIVVNLLLISIYGMKIEFPICSAMAGFQTNNLLLPLITAVSGIAFWLKVSQFLVPVFGQSRLINYISDNTFFIMTHHLGVKHLFIALCILGSNLGWSACSGIDLAQYLSDGFYLYDAHPWCAPACFIFTMAVLLLACKLCQRIGSSLVLLFRRPNQTA